MKRVSRGMSVQESIEKESNRNENDFEYNGKVYSTITDLARDYNIVTETLRQRLKIGMSLDQAIKSPINTLRVEKYRLEDLDKVSIKYCDKKCENLPELCRLLDIKRTTVSSNLSRGYSLDESVFKALHNKRAVMYKGKKYKTLKDLCNEYGVNYNTVINILSSGNNIDVAMEYVINIKTK